MADENENKEDEIITNPETAEDEEGLLEQETPEGEDIDSSDPQDGDNFEDGEEDPDDNGDDKGGETTDPEESEGEPEPEEPEEDPPEEEDENEDDDQDDDVNPDESEEPEDPPTDPGEDPDEGDDTDPTDPDEPDNPEGEGNEGDEDDEEKEKFDWVNSGQTKLISKRSTDLKIENNQEGQDQTANQDKLKLEANVEEDGTYDIELSGKLSSLSKWTSTDSNHADKQCPWYGIEFCFNEDPVGKVKYNETNLEESDIVDKENHSIILWLDIDSLVEEPKTFALKSEEEDIEEKFKISFTNTDVNVEIDPDKFPDINVTPTGPDINIGDNLDPGYTQEPEPIEDDLEPTGVYKYNGTTLKRVKYVNKTVRNDRTVIDRAVYLDSLSSLL